MTIASRIREERQRLGLSQTAFAALAGATKSAQIKWEGGTSSAPTAPALASWAAAGADVLYILTGRRTGGRTEDAASQIEDQLARIRRDLLDAGRFMRSNESEEDSRERFTLSSVNQLKAILAYDKAFLTLERVAEVEQLLDIAENPASLSLYQAADFAQNRKRRAEVRQRLAEWLEGGPYEPNDAVTKLLVSLATEYGVPIRFLVELVEELHTDLAAK